MQIQAAHLWPDDIYQDKVSHSFNCSFMWSNLCVEVCVDAELKRGGFANSVSISAIGTVIQNKTGLSPIARLNVGIVHFCMPLH